MTECTAIPNLSKVTIKCMKWHKLLGFTKKCMVFKKVQKAYRTILPGTVGLPCSWE